ncbi:MAG TPA: YciI family protein [Polyangiaceae bacterium]|nr:YciI family protein [Polyangiaceae bacterium]
MKYMLLMNVPNGGPYQLPSWAPQDIQAHIAFLQNFARRLRDAGELVAAEALTAPDQAQHVRAGKDGQALTDGVFPEAKEFLAGFWIVDVDTAERARAIAAEVSASPGPGRIPLQLVIEVRQVMGAPCP